VLGGRHGFGASHIALRGGATAHWVQRPWPETGSVDFRRGAGGGVQLTRPRVFRTPASTSASPLAIGKLARTGPGWAHVMATLETFSTGATDPSQLTAPGGSEGAWQLIHPFTSTPAAQSPAGSPASPATPNDAHGPATGPAAGFDSKGRVRRRRVSAVWVGLITAAVFLILLVVFIAQNLTEASVHFLGLDGHLPLGLTILVSAIIGLLIAAVPGTIRILQLRRALKRNTPRGQRAAT
jgi:uncharacterized integral membrane protein